MGPGSTEPLVAQINERLNARQYAAGLLIVGIVFSIVVSMISKVAAIPVLTLTVVAFILALGADHKRRTFEILYDETERKNPRWQAMTDAMCILAESEKLWMVEDTRSTSDSKRNAGATQLISRVGVRILEAAPPFIETNVTPVTLDLGAQQLYLLPDQVFVYRPREYTTASYDAVTMEARTIDFREMGSLPKDAQQIGQTWRYVNKDGSPDRRFSNNLRVPIARYGLFSIVLGKDLQFTLHVSSAQAAISASTKFHLSNAANRQDAYSGHQRRTSHSHDKKSQDRKDSSQPPHSLPKGEPLPACYTILNLSATCSREEASAAYHKLARPALYP